MAQTDASGFNLSGGVPGFGFGGSFSKNPQMQLFGNPPSGPFNPWLLSQMPSNLQHVWSDPAFQAWLAQNVARQGWIFNYPRPGGPVGPGGPMRLIADPTEPPQLFDLLNAYLSTTTPKQGTAPGTSSPSAGAAVTPGASPAPSSQASPPIYATGTGGFPVFSQTALGPLLLQALLPTNFGVNPLSLLGRMF